MSTHESIEEAINKPHQKNKIIRPALFIVLFFVGMLMISMAFSASHYYGDYYYRAYVLEDQYIGDITVHGTTYNDVLIMKVQPLKDIHGNIDLIEPMQKYGFHVAYNLNDPISNFEPYGSSHLLYFANENRTISDIQGNDIIVARWLNPYVGNDRVQGIKKIEGWTY
jgi:hypothetical protein